MTTTAFTAKILSTSAPGLARLTAERILAQLQDAEPYGSDPLLHWREHMEGRIVDLSRAIEDDRPQQFSDQIGWAKVAFTSRGVPETDLEQSLRCLRDVLAAELPDDVAATSTAVVDAALARWSQIDATEPTNLDAETPEGRLAARYVVALLEGDRRAACSLVLDEVRAGKLEARDAILRVCLPVERELGRMWHLDEITIAEEHFVSATTVRLMSQLVALAPEVESNGKVVVAASLTGDDHDIGLRAVTDLFELDGWRAVFLGNNLPAEDLVWAVDAFEADVVLLSATLTAHVRPVIDAVSRLAFRRDTQPDARAVHCLIGGPAFATRTDLAEEIAGDATLVSARDAVALGRKLAGLAPQA